MRLGIFQSACNGLTPDRRIARLAGYLARQPVDLVVCPELFISGYNVGDDLIERAEAVGGPSFDAMAALATSANTAILYGYPERGSPGLFNSAALVGPDGTLLANHRKRFNSPGSFEERYFSSGDSPTLVTFSDFRFAILICYEAELSEFARQAAMLGAEAVLVASALVAEWRTVAERLVPTRAFENGVWLAYANHGGSENGFDYLGGSRIVAPDGSEEAVAGQGEELISTVIDKARVTAARTRLPFLRDARIIAEGRQNPDGGGHAR